MSGEICHEQSALEIRLKSAIKETRKESSNPKAAFAYFLDPADRATVKALTTRD
jgi:hypothetical protein